MELIGLFLPFVIEVVNKDVRDDNERLIVAFLVSFVVACIIEHTQLLTINFDNFWIFLTSFSKLFLLLIGETYVAFNLYWKPFFRDRVQKLLGVSQN